MNSFRSAKEIEAEGLRHCIPYCEKFHSSGHLVMTDGQLFVQKFIGDMVIKDKESKTRTIEFKAEAENKYGNLFLESWSSLGFLSPGWMNTSLAMDLWYYFVKERELYMLSMVELKRWAFAKNERETMANIYQFPERRQAKYEQSNDTWGWCVPIAELKRRKSLEMVGPVNPIEEVQGARQRRLA